MHDLAFFYRILLKTLRKFHEDHRQAFLDQFNDAAKRTAKNRRPRTDLMLGSRINDRSGVVPVALGEFLGKVQPSYERYLDCIVYEGEWWEGRCIAQLIAEVKNNFNEFKGTVSDLLRHQAHQKVAIFYEDSSKSERERLEESTRMVFGVFDQQGFYEAPSTEYLIVLGPRLLAGGDGIGDWRGMWFTKSTLDRPVWM
jgi:hypothetical protein